MTLSGEREVGVSGRALGFSPLSFPSLANRSVRKTGRRARPDTPTSPSRALAMGGLSPGFGGGS
jgi:hypothetical protein